MFGGRDLSEVVQRFVARAKKQPTDATDPNVLAALLRAAKESVDGVFAASHAPIALYTWELDAALATGDVESGRVELRFPRAVEIVGFFPTIVNIYGGVLPLTTPTLDDVRVVIDANHERELSSRQAQSTLSGVASQAVTLSAISVMAPRLFRMKIDTPNPQLGMNFQWKRGVNVYKDALISVACFCKWLRPSEV